MLNIISHQWNAKLNQERYHCTLTRTEKKTDSAKYSPGYEANGTHIPRSLEMQTHAASLEKDLGNFLKF